MLRCRKLTAILSIWIFTIMSYIPTSSAMWAPLSLKELTQQSALIVTGEILGRDTIQASATFNPLTLAVLKIDKVIKGDKNQHIAYLRLPSHPQGVVASDDIQLKDGQKGLWYLRKFTDGIYVIDRPDRYVAPAQVQKHLADLKKMGF